MRRTIEAIGLGLALLLAIGCDNEEVQEAGDAIGDAAVETGEALDDAAAEGAEATGKALEDTGERLQQSSGGSGGDQN